MPSRSRSDVESERGFVRDRLSPLNVCRFLDPQCHFNPLLNAVSSYVNVIELDLVSGQDSNRTPIAASTGARRRRRRSRNRGASGGPARFEDPGM
jgi:hypothetical protein